LSPSANMKEICTMCQAMGVTWEGVWDGDACLAISRSAALTTAAGATCPT
jgi:hypothetical protein